MKGERRGLLTVMQTRVDLAFYNAAIPQQYEHTCQECHVVAYGKTAREAFTNIEHAERCTYVLTVAADLARRAAMSFATWEQELRKAGKLW